MKASIIVPSYKRIDQTLKTLELLHNSDIPNDISTEIVVADCTPDNSLKSAIEDRFGDKIVYTRPEKEGIATNKNQGARVAKGNILIFCDSDIEVEKDTVKKTITYLQQNKHAAAVGGQVLWRGGGKDGGFDRPRPEDRRYEYEGFLAVEAIYSRYIATYKEVFDEVGGYDEQVFNMRGEGSDLSLRYWRAGYSLFFEPNIKVHHVYDAPDSIALRVAHPEWAIAKDLMLLNYKYDMLSGDYQNFNKTVKANFNKYGDDSGAEILKGLVDNYEFIASVKPALDEDKNKMKMKYDFKFLEVFSNENLLLKCLRESEFMLDKIKNPR